MNLARDIVYGRRGGRWSAAEAASAGGHVRRLRCVGGPLNGLCVAMHTWGETPSVPTELPVGAEGGRYQLAATYVWRPDHPEVRP
jgi:hypothetical protein